MFFYQISTLTTGKDTFTGGAQNDMFTASLAGATSQAHTLTAGDILDGGDGDDTLILDAQGDIVAGLQTVKNIENLKVYESATWTGNVSEFAGLKNVEVTANGAVTLTTGVSVTDVTVMNPNGATGAAVTTTLNGDSITDVTARYMASSYDDILTVNNTTAKHTLNVALDKVGKYVDGSAADHVLSIVDAAAETIALTSNGVKNVAALGVSGTANTVLKTVTITGKGDLVLDLNGADGSTAVTTIDGSKAAGDLTLTDLADATATITTGAGDDSFTTGAIAGKATINTGAGDDEVTLAAGAAGAAGAVLTAGSTITLGDGDDTLTMDFADLTTNLKLDAGANAADGGDALIFSDAANFVTTATKYAFVKDHGFEVVGVKGDFTLTANADKLGVKEFYQEGAAEMVLTDVAGGSTITLAKGTLNTTTSSYTMKAANSTLNLVLENVGDTPFVSTATNHVTTVQANIINVSSDYVADATHTSSATTNEMFLVAQANATVNLTGSQALEYTNNANVAQVIKAEGFTGKLTITGNDSVDTIYASANGDTITGGKGADVITGGAGVDTFIVKTTTATVESQATAFDIIRDFNVGGKSDILRFAAAENVAGDGGNATAATSVSVLNGKATFAAGDDTLAKMLIALRADTDIANNETVFFEVGGDTYIYGAGANRGSVTDNFLIELAGVTGFTTLTESAAAAGDFTLA